MKYLIVLMLVALVAADEAQLTNEQKEKAHGYAVHCIEAEGVTKEQAIALRQGKFDSVDDKVKCFANCFLEQAGFIADGQIKPDVVLAKLGPAAGADNIKAVQAKCDSIKGSDKCDTAFQVYKCYYQNKAQI